VSNAALDIVLSLILMLAITAVVVSIAAVLVR
jgi:hypothetical protein